MCEIGNYVLIASMLRKERDRQTERVRKSERERSKGRGDYENRRKQCYYLTFK